MKKIKEKYKQLHKYNFKQGSGLILVDINALLVCRKGTELNDIIYEFNPAFCKLMDKMQHQAKTDNFPLSNFQLAYFTNQKDFEKNRIVKHPLKKINKSCNLDYFLKEVNENLQRLSATNSIKPINKNNIFPIPLNSKGEMQLTKTIIKKLFGKYNPNHVFVISNNDGFLKQVEQDIGCKTILTYQDGELNRDDLMQVTKRLKKSNDKTRVQFHIDIDNTALLLTTTNLTGSTAANPFLAKSLIKFKKISPFYNFKFLTFRCNIIYNELIELKKALLIQKKELHDLKLKNKLLIPEIIENLTIFAKKLSTTHIKFETKYNEFLNTFEQLNTKEQQDLDEKIYSLNIIQADIKRLENALIEWKKSAISEFAVQKIYHDNYDINIKFDLYSFVGSAIKKLSKTQMIIIAAQKNDPYNIHILIEDNTDELTIANSNDAKKIFAKLGKELLTIQAHLDGDIDSNSMKRFMEFFEDIKQTVAAKSNKRIIEHNSINTTSYTNQYKSKANTHSLSFSPRTKSKNKNSHEKIKQKQNTSFNL